MIFPFVPVFIVFTGLYRFVFRYQGLSSACPGFGTLLVQYLSSTCPKNEHLDTAPLIWIIGRDIANVFPIGKLPDTTMVGGFGTDLGIGHHLLPTDMEFLQKIIMVPQLEQPDIKADMGRVQTAVLGKLGQHGVQVFDIIDLFHLQVVMDLVAFQYLHDLMVLVIKDTPYLGKGKGPVDAKVLEGPR